MELLKKELSKKVERPVKILQFGEGNFLRGFVDYMIDIANTKGCFDGDIAVVKPRESGSMDKLLDQECQYTVLLRGLVDKKPTVSNHIVTSVADAVYAYHEYDRYSEFAKLETLRFVVSNTTEAGIVYDAQDRPDMCPPNSFPGKLTKFLYERYQHFNGDPDKGLIMLPTELIDDNGNVLKDCVLRQIENWKLEDAFRMWVEEACVFASTLVDRIISGFPKEEAEKLWKQWGYEDHCIVAGEPFALWVIESSEDISKELPLDQAGLPALYTDNLKPYKQRKVRILNGAHTSFVLASFLAGNDTVLESMEDELIFGFMNRTIYGEVIPTLALPEKELKDFTEEVIARFKNPYMKHALLSISLNSVFKWKTRCLPSVLAYVKKTGCLPDCLTFSLAALMAFYSSTERSGKALIGKRSGEIYEIKDEEAVLDFFAENCEESSAELTSRFLSKEEFWGQDLTKINGFTKKTAAYLDDIRECGMRKAMMKHFG